MSYLLRIAFAYFFIQVLPLDPEFFHHLGAIDWAHLHFQDLLGLSIWMPGFSWVAALIISIIIGAAWQSLRPLQPDFERCYPLLRFLLRLRLAFAVIAAGMIQASHIQVPAPTLSDLNTSYGQFLPWRIWYLTTGASQAHYQLTLGLLEVTGGLLLLYKRTVVIGAALITALLTNIVTANFAYRMGDQAYSTYLLVLSIAILAHDIPRLYELLVTRRLTIPEPTPAIPRRQQRLVLITKTILLIYAITLATLTFGAEYPLSAKPGLDNAAGYYTVRKNDHTEWKDVVFETWNTLSVRRNIPAKPDLTRPTLTAIAHQSVDYESAGNGERTFYTYSTDSTNTLTLISKTDPDDYYKFQITRAAPKTIDLRGVTARGDSLHIILDKQDKKYNLIQGRRTPQKI